MVRRVVGVLLALVALQTLTAGAPAHAERWERRDAAKDVVATTYDPEPAPCGTVTQTPAPTARSADIRRLVVDHRRSEVTVSVRLRALAPDDKPSISLHLRDSNGRDWLVDVNRVEPSIGRLPQQPLVEDDCSRIGILLGACTGMDARYAHIRDSVLLTLPRACIRRPRWIRVATSVTAFENGPTFTSYHDQVGAPGAGDWVGELGPRIRRAGA